MTIRLKDRVWVDSKLGSRVLYCHFEETGVTGKLSAVSMNLHGLLRMSIEQIDGSAGGGISEGEGGFAIMVARTNDQAESVEVFATNAAARAAVRRISGVLRRQRWSLFGRIGIVLGGLLALVICAGLASGLSKRFAGGGNDLSGALQMRSDFARQYAEQRARAVPTAAYAAQVPTPQADVYEADAKIESTGRIDPAKLTGLTKLSFGKGKPGFYVFSDPTCSSCRELDERLSMTGRSFTLLPVAIRGEDAAREAVKILCSRDPSSSWRRSISSIGTAQIEFAANRGELASCANKVKVNMDAFREFGFSGTPTIVAPDGRWVTGIESLAALDVFLRRK